MSVYHANLVQGKIFAEVLLERQRQDRLHPDFPKDMRMLIFNEEVGEVSKALYEGDIDHAKTEMIQAIAVLVRWYEHLEIEWSDDE